jgi:hypothetical protein
MNASPSKWLLTVESKHDFLEFELDFLKNSLDRSKAGILFFADNIFKELVNIFESVCRNYYINDQPI